MFRKASLFAKRYKHELAIAAQTVASIAVVCAIRSLQGTIEIQQQEIEMLKMDVDDLNIQTEIIDHKLDLMDE